jgi:hypothetical protein
LTSAALPASKNTKSQNAGALRPQASGLLANQYLVNPLFDYTFICGGLALALAGAALTAFGTDAVLANNNASVIALSALGTYVIAEPHSAATLFKLYGESANRNKYKFVAFALPLLLAICFAWAVASPLVAQLLTVAYLAFIGQHVMAQSYGIAMLYARRAGYKSDRLDYCYIRAIKYGCITLAVLQQFSPSWQRQSFIGIKLATTAFVPEAVISTVQALVYVTVTAFIATIMLKHLKGEKHLPLPAVTVTLTGALVISLNRAFSEVVWLFVPAFFHACQYLCVVLALHLKKEKTAADHKTPTSGFYNFEIVGTHFLECLLVGLVIFIGIPAALAACGLPFATGAALTFLTVNLHHFAADACIWKTKR